MVDMGVPNYLVASSVIAVLAQRLVRVICNRCKNPWKPSAAVLEQAGITPEMAQNAEFSRGKGCNYCNKTGYRGRIAIFEIMKITSGIRELIFNNESSVAIRNKAIEEGMTTLYQDGLNKVIEAIEHLTQEEEQKLVDMEEAFHGGKLKCCFDGGDMFITLQGGNLFEPGTMFKRLDDPDRVRELLSDFAAVFNIIDSVVANRRAQDPRAGG